MLKSHNLISIVIGLLFLIILQTFSLPQPIFRFLVPAVLLLASAVAVYNYWYLKKIQKYNFWILLRQFMLFFSAFGVLTLLPSAASRGMFLVITVILVMLFESLVGSFAENLLINETLFIVFGFFITLTAYSQYFLTFNGAGGILKVLGLSVQWNLSLQPFYVLAVFAVTFLATRSFYEFIPQSQRVKLVNSLAIGLFCTELFWALTFLPFHFSALAILLFNVYYFCLILNYYYLYQTLNAKKMKFHFALILICSTLVLLITPWKVIN